jgi:MoxR-like ATPase
MTTSVDVATIGGHIIHEVERAIVGKRRLLEQILVAAIAGGHILLEDYPGLAKTLIAKSFAAALGLEFKRIQFTPDLLPSDITGSVIYDRSQNRFELRKGPIFANIVLADEINRASPKTQSALLQSMQEHHVTVAGQRHDVPVPFHVLATQNPLEQEGTYPLPEAQLDRFLLEIDVSYPDLAAERRMLYATTGTDERRVEAVLSATELITIQRLVRQIPVPDKVVEAILALVRSARPGSGGETDRYIAWGPGPRASQALMLAVRAKALIDGRLAPSIDDVVALAEPVLKHRMALSFAARAEGQDLSALIARLAHAVE